MKRAAAHALNTRIALRSKAHRSQKEGPIPSYCEAINYFLETYAVDDVIVQTDTNIMSFTQLSNKSPTEYTEAFWNNAHQWNSVSDEYVLKEISIEGLSESVRRSTRSYWSSKKDSTLHDVAHRANLLTKLQHDIRNTDAPYHKEKTDNRRENTKRRDSNVNNNILNSSSSTKSSLTNTSFLQSPPIAIPIWHQQLQRTPQSFSPPLSTTPIDHAPFFLFFLAKNHHTKYCSATPSRFSAMLINTIKANLPSIVRPLQWYLSNSYCRSSRTKYRSTPTM